MRSDMTSPVKVTTVYWVLLIKMDDYAVDLNLVRKSIDYFEFLILGEYLCILVDNRRWLATPDLEEYIHET